jgi:hypothetical protein
MPIPAREFNESSESKGNSSQRDEKRMKCIFGI